MYMKGGSNEQIRKKFKEEKGMSNSEKKRLNDVAMELAIRDEDRIVYDEKYPLIINSELRIIEMYRRSDEEEKFEKNKMDSILNNYDYDEYNDDFLVKTSMNEYRLVFEKNENESDNYIMDVGTYLSLDELEERLTKCENDQDIELIADDED